jgi:cellulose synthase/poly-beta-1,6-N-acetylglucosamine synthase-like glycosyltransferase
MTGLATAVFVLSLAGCAYVYAGYPALLAVLARLRPRPVGMEANTPRLSVIVAAHNEREIIEEKIRDTLMNGYPLDRMEIIVASDGSLDGTEAAARKMGHPQVKILTLPRRGKLRTLASAAQVASGEVIVFTDADTLLEPGSLGYLVQGFADPEVGAVAGRKRVVHDGARSAMGQSEGLYRRFDEWQKEQESRMGNAVAADGTLYAVRRQLLDPGLDPAAADDMAISMRVAVKGYRLVYEPRAVVLVKPPSAQGAELRRKVRIANQAIRALLGLGPALWTSGLYSLQLISHKLLRYAVPFLLMTLFASNLLLALAVGGTWTGLLSLQLAFYGLAALGARLHRDPIGSMKLLSIPYYFCLMNLAAFLAVLSVLRGERIKTWFPGAGTGQEVT